MKHAPPILGTLEFAGMNDKLILVEHDDDDDINLMWRILHNKINIIFSPAEITPKFGSVFTAVVITDTIARVHKMMKSVNAEIDYVVIDRIDLMDSNFTKRERGAQIKAFISMMNNKRILRGANLIVTSCKSEYTIREMADRYISLRK